MTESVVGLILAGGLSQRMGGGHKALANLNGKPIIETVIERARSQVGDLMISANDPEAFRDFNLPIISDLIEGAPGPLTGILSALSWLRENQSHCSWLMSFPSDTPFFPLDAVPRLLAAGHNEKASIVCAQSGGQRHYVFALWSVTILDALEQQVRVEKNFRVWEFQEKLKTCTVDFSTAKGDPFFNINTRDDLAKAQTLAPEFDKRDKN